MGGLSCCVSVLIGNDQSEVETFHARVEIAIAGAISAVFPWRRAVSEARLCTAEHGETADRFSCRLPTVRARHFLAHFAHGNALFERRITGWTSVFVEGHSSNFLRSCGGWSPRRTQAPARRISKWPCGVSARLGRSPETWRTSSVTNLWPLRSNSSTMRPRVAKPSPNVLPKSGGHRWRHESRGQVERLGEDGVRKANEIARMKDRPSASIRRVVILDLVRGT